MTLSIKAYSSSAGLIAAAAQLITREHGFGRGQSLGFRLALAQSCVVMIIRCKSLSIPITLLLILQFVILLPACCQSAADNSTNLDLGSTNATINASSLGQVQGVVITVGDTNRTIGSADQLTPAEYVAAMQVLSSGQQSLQLGNSGQAISGQFTLTSSLSQNLGNLVIPQGVTAIQDFAMTSALNLSGNLSNSGNFYAISTSAQVNTASISAVNIFNNVGGLLSSVLPSGGIVPPSAINGLSLNLTVINDIVNSGSIQSAGNLTVMAGGSIVNALPSGMSAAVPLMQAMNSVNLILGMGNIVNSGVIASQMANINIATLTGQLPIDILVNNIGGQLQALNGDINVRDSAFIYKNNLTVMGGDLIARELKLYSGDGIVNLNVQDMVGRTNIYAGEAHIISTTSNLTLGDMVLTGDPTFYNTAGDVTISGNLVFAGQGLALLASRNIITAAGAGQIDTHSNTGNGGAIMILAGVQMTSIGPASGSNDTTSSVTVTGPSATGGYIDLTTGGAITSLTSRGATISGNGNGGDISLVAYAGTSAESGKIILPTNAAITTGGNGTGTDGRVYIYSQAPSGIGIQVGDINTSGGINNLYAQGHIEVRTNSTPILSLFTPGPVVVTNGISTGYDLGYTNLPPVSTASIRTGSLTVGSERTTLPVTITVSGSGNVLVDGNIVANATSSGSSGGSVTLASNSSTAFRIGVGTTLNGVNGTISANGFSGVGGNITVSAMGSGGIDLPSASALSMNATNGIGGNLILFAPNSAIVFGTGGGIINVNGAGLAGAGGTIKIDAQALNIVTGNYQLIANASGNAKGGAIQISVYGPASDLNIGSGAGEMSLQAIGNSTNPAIDGAGGSINLAAGRDINVGNTSAINVNSLGVNGSGGKIKMLSGFSGEGNINILAGTLRADAAGTTLDAGTIELTANSASPFILNSSVTASSSGGQDGTITIRNNGSGGIITNSGTSFDAASLLIDSGTNGALSLASSTFSIPTVIMKGKSLTITGGALVGAANRISIFLVGEAADLTIGNGAGQLNLSSGCISCEISVGRNLTVNTSAGFLGGNGGTVILRGGAASKGNVFINGSVISRSFGEALRIFTNSDVAFTIGAGATINGVNGSISVNSITAPRSNGTIGIYNSGSGGITILDPANIIATSAAITTNGRGGNIELNAGEGQLQFATGGILGAFGNGTGPGQDGGSITLTASNIVNTGASAVVLNVNGMGTGNAGAINITTLDPNAGNLTFNNSAGNFVLSAIGSNDAVNTDRGTIAVSSTGNIIVQSSGLLVTPTFPGNGASITLIAGTGSIGGTVFVNTNLDVNGSSGAGSATYGGEVTIISNSSTIFAIAAGASANGVDGTISANGNSVFGGQAGKIKIINRGSGGITLASAASLSVTGGASWGGGEIILEAPSGDITFNSGGNLNVSAGVSSNLAAGNLRLIANNIFVLGAGALALINDTGSLGGGGSILVRTLSSTSDLVISNTPGNIAIQSRRLGTGGLSPKVNIETGRNLTVNVAALTIAPILTGNNGTNLTLQAGFVTNGDLSINGSLSTNGGTNGSGGSITLISNSANSFDINLGNVSNGINGTISANAGGGSGGNGGLVSITNFGTGGIRFNSPSSVAVNSNNSHGGSIELNAYQGVLTFNSSGALNVNGTGNGNGGGVTIRSLSLSISGGPLTINAVGTGNGLGAINDVRVTTLSAAYDLNIGNASGEITILAQGGATSAEGGEVVLSSGRHVNINPAFFTLGPGSAVNAKAGTLTVTAGTAGDGNVFINGSLNMIGSGTGAGGIVTLVSKSATAFTIGAGAALNGINGTITLSGGAGGRLSISNLGTGGISLLATTNISVAASNGVGGLVELKSPTGTIAISNGALSVNAGGTSFIGGTINIEAGILGISGGSLSLSANATGTSKGGTVTVKALAAGSDLTVGTNVGNIAISATGGSTLSAAGDGGTIELVAGRSLTVEPVSLNVNPQGNQGAGGTLKLTSGYATTGNLLINGNLSANGTGSQNGGIIQLLSRGNTAFYVGTGIGANGINGVLSAQNGTGTSGFNIKGGTISIENIGSTGITIGSYSNLSINSVTGRANGGTIILNAGAGVLTLPAGTLSAAVTKDVDGGTINLTASALNLLGSVALVAGSVQSNRGGTISVTTTSSSYSLNIDASNLTIQTASTAGWNSSGTGGTVNLSSGSNIYIDGKYFNINTPCLGCRGANVSLIAGTGGSGTLLVQGGLNVSGMALGDTGTLTIQTNSPSTFIIGSGASVNGVTGGVSVGTGYSGGNLNPQQGFISITNLGGGITIEDSRFFGTFVSGNASGVNITLNANGQLSVPGGNLLATNIDVFATSGFGSLAGGSVNLSASTLNITGGQALHIVTNGVRNWSAGNVSIVLSSGSLVVGPNAGEVMISALGGAAGNSIGGNITLSSAPNSGSLIVNTSYLKFNSLFTTGGSGSIALSGYSVFVNGNLNTSSFGVNNAGSISINSNNASVFTINPGVLSDGVNGTLIAVGGNTGGNAGSISINTTGGITVTSASSINTGSTMTVSAGSGGNITLSTQGVLNLPTGSYYQNSRGTDINSNAGSMTMSASFLAIAGGTLLDLRANSRGAGGGGLIRVQTTGNGSNLAVNSTNIIAYALGGAGNIASSAGGSVVIRAGGNLSVDMTAAATKTRALSGNGGSFTFRAGEALLGTGNLSVNGSVNSSGVGMYGNAANGGNIDLLSDSTVAFNITGLGVNSILGALLARSGEYGGNGGGITVNNLNSNGDIIVNTLSSLAVNSRGYGDSALGIGGGNGGTIAINNLTLSSGNVNIPVGIITTGSMGKFLNPNINGGSITIRAADIIVLGAGSLILSADGSGQGSGGTISVAETGSAANLVLGAGIGELQLSARGGSYGASFTSLQLGGAGGNASVSTSSTTSPLTVDVSFINVGPRGVSGNGGSIILAASAQAVQINGNLSANGAGYGNGGTVSITSTGSSNFAINCGGCAEGVAGIISVNAGAFMGNAGTININKNNGALNLASLADLSVLPTRGNGGTLSLTADTMILPTGTLSVNGTGFTGNGGTINLTSGVFANGLLQVNGSLTANGSGSANGGTININYGEPGSNSFMVGGAVTNNGVTGNILANASGFGIGGAIAITNGAVNALYVVNDGTISAGTITINKAGQAVTVSGSGTMIGAISSLGSTVSIQSANSMSFAAITASAGGIVLTADTGVVRVLQSVTIAASGGDITIQNLDTFTGSILIENRAIISATDVSNGKIYIVLGSVPSTPVSGLQPANFVANLSNGGTIYYGTNSVATLAPTNTANINEGSLIFDTGALGASAIILGGAVTISIAPVPLPPAPPSPACSDCNASLASSILSEPARVVLPAAIISNNYVNLSNTVISTDQNIGSTSDSLGLALSGEFMSGNLGFGTIAATIDSVPAISNLTLTGGNGSNFSMLENASIKGTVNSNLFVVDTGDINVDLSNIPSPANSEMILVNESRSDLMVFATPNQIFSGTIGGSADITLKGSPGTVLSVDNQTVMIHTGRLVVDTKKQSLRVQTRAGIVTVNAHSTVLINAASGVTVNNFSPSSLDGTELMAAESLLVGGAETGEAKTGQSQTRPINIMGKHNAMFMLTGSNQLELTSGELLLDFPLQGKVVTPLGTVSVVKGAIVAVGVEKGVIRVRACTGLGSVVLHNPKTKIPLSAGSELMLFDHQPTKYEAIPKDGIGRRNLVAHRIDNELTAVLGDFSVVSLLHNSSHLKTSRSSGIESRQHLVNRLSKTAAAIEQVTKLKGPYFSQPKESVHLNLPDWPFAKTSTSGWAPLLGAMVK